MVGRAAAGRTAKKVGGVRSLGRSRSSLPEEPNLSEMSSNWKLPRRRLRLQRPRSVAGRCANVASVADCWPARPDCLIRKRMEPPTGVDGVPAGSTSATGAPN